MYTWFRVLEKEELSMSFAHTNMFLLYENNITIKIKRARKPKNQNKHERK